MPTYINPARRDRAAYGNYNGGYGGYGGSNGRGTNLIPSNNDNGVPAAALPPEARGKAAAMDAWLAQGGPRFNGDGTFKSGPIKGMTIDQAKQAFESKWANASDEIKNHYAAIGGNVNALSPSELAQRQASVTPVTPPIAKQQNRTAGYGYRFDANGNFVRVNSPTATVVNNPVATVAPVGTNSVLAPGAQGVPQPTATPATTNAPPAQSQPASATTPTATPTPTVPVTPVNPLAAPVVPGYKNQRGYSGNQSQTPVTPVPAPADMPQPPSNAVIGSPFGGTSTLPETLAANDPAYAAKREAQQKAADDAQSAKIQHDKDTAANFVRQQNSERIARGLPTESVDPGSSTRSQNIAAATDSSGNVDLSKLSSDDRMFVQGKTNAGGVPAQKATPQVEPMATGNSSTPANTPTGKPALTPMQQVDMAGGSLTTEETLRGYQLLPQGSQTPDGMELIGNRGGNSLYAPIGDIYVDTPKAAVGPAGDGSGPTRAASTPDSIRADYQRKQSTPAVQAAANRSMISSGVVPPPVTPVTPSFPQGPASQSQPINNPPRADGYQPTSLRQDWDRDEAAAQQRAQHAQDVKDAYDIGGDDAVATVQGNQARSYADQTRIAAGLPPLDQTTPVTPPKAIQVKNPAQSRTGLSPTPAFAM